MATFPRKRSRGAPSGAVRADMDAALTSMVAESLRPAGFTGSLPHLRRILEDRIDLISVQHHAAGGSFVVEVACSPPEGVTSAGRRIPGSKVRALDINSPRPRLGSPSFPGQGDHWFTFGPRSYDEPSFHGYPSPSDVADDVLRRLREEAEPWWQTKPFPPSLPGPATD